MTKRGRAVRSATGELIFDAVDKFFHRPGTPAHVHAVRQVSLELGPDELVGVIGPNGAGKSTLLRMAAGVSAPSRGEVRRSGRTCSVIELGIGIHPDLTGRENLELLGRLHGLGAAELRSSLAGITDFAGLGTAFDDPCSTYSTGMLARLSFSVAVHTRPDLLILDEVLSVGDLDFQQRCRDKIAELRRGGVTVVLVSHDLGLVEDLCERAILLVDGAVEADGPAPQVIRRYLGLPGDDVDDDEVLFRLETSLVCSGDPVTVVVEHHLDEPGMTVEVDLVIREHPTFLGVGESLSVVFGSTSLQAPPENSFTVELETAGMPGGRFEVQGALVDSTGSTIVRRTMPLTVTAPPGPFAIRLSGNGGIDGADTAPPLHQNANTAR
jgi:ABC-type polysaccharide/polyol phosphate transport system ATPase subunit